jgi:hypothetical protein
MISSARLIILALLLPVFASCQLYLLTGNPWHPNNPTHDPNGPPTSPSSLLRLGSDGTVRVVRILAPESLGTAFIGISNRERKAVFVSQPRGYSKPTATVVDFDKGAVVKKCEFPDTNIQEYWLVVQPKLGAVLEWRGDPPSSRDELFYGLILDPSLPCEKSLWTPEAADLVYVEADSGAGSSRYLITGLKIEVGLNDQHGDVLSRFTRIPRPLGFRVPRLAALRNDQPTFVQLIVNDSRLAALAFSAGREAGILYSRKDDGVWQEISMPSSPEIFFRGFGGYISAVDFRQRNSQTISIFDLQTQQRFSLTMPDLDCEVLLVENGTVYYRAGRRLYSARMTPAGMGPPHFLASAKVVEDAHWAFVARPAASR